MRQDKLAGDGGRRLRRDPRNDLALDSGPSRHGGHGLLAHRPRCRQPARARQSRRLPCSTSKCRSLTASPRCRGCWRKKRDLINHHGVDADRRNAEISFKALSLGASELHSKAGKARARPPPPRPFATIPDPEDFATLGAKVRRAAPAHASLWRRFTTGRGSPQAVRRWRRLRSRNAAPPVQHAAAAGAPDRFVDRRSAGPDVAGR